MKIDIRGLLKNFNQAVTELKKLSSEQWAAVYDTDGTMLCTATLPSLWTGGNPFDEAAYEWQQKTKTVTKVALNELRSRPFSGEAAGYYRLIRAYRPLKGFVDERVEATVNVPIGGGGDYFLMKAKTPGESGNRMTFEVVIPATPNHPLLLQTTHDGLHHTLYAATNGSSVVTTQLAQVLAAFTFENAAQYPFYCSQGGSGGNPLEVFARTSFSGGEREMPAPWPVFQITHNNQTLMWLSTYGHSYWQGYDVLADAADSGSAITP